MILLNVSREDSVREFHRAMGHPVDREPDASIMRLRRILIREETDELSEELSRAAEQLANRGKIDDVTKQKILKEMADLQYVLSGLAVAFGLPIEAAFNRVHKSNMSKLGENGLPLYRSDGKVQKGPNYQPPDMEGLW